jgi:hypothetical protein
MMDIKKGTEVHIFQASIGTGKTTFLYNRIEELVPQFLPTSVRKRWIAILVGPITHYDESDRSVSY